MEKKKKFLLSFVIAYVIVMGLYLIITTITAVNCKNIVNEESKYFLDGGTTLTEEGKKYMDNILPNFEERLEYFLNKATYDEKITFMAMEYYNTHLGMAYIMYYGYSSVATTIFAVFLNIVILTFVIYSMISIELKNKKQYILENVKLFLSYIVLFTFIALSINLHSAYVDGYYGGYTAAEILDSVTNDIVLVIVVSVFMYIITAGINLIINLIKNSKKKKLVKEK